jgi:SAM-dependent methyltransferase
MKPSNFGPESWGPLAEAFQAYAAGDQEARVVVHTDVGDPETLPMSIFFRSEEDFRGPDREALTRARGRVLDAGAGVGSVTLALQSRGLFVTALEVIPEAVEIMRNRGVANPVVGRLEELPPARSFDTILLLMNGTALAGSLAGLGPFLQVLEGLLAPRGQILMDSTDLTSGWDSGDDPPKEAEGDYPGNLQYQLEFRGRKGSPFPQLFVDPTTLAEIAASVGWRTRVVWRSDQGEYLARLVRVIESPGPMEDLSGLPPSDRP